MSALKVVTKIKPFWGLLLGFIFCLLDVDGPGAAILLAETPDVKWVDKIVAVVNAEVITQSEVNRVLAALEAEYKGMNLDDREFTLKFNQAKENIVNQMIEEKLILSEAKKYDLKIDEDKIEARIEKIKKGFSNDEEFEQALQLQEVTLKELRERFREQEIMKKAVDLFVRAVIKVDPQGIKEFYETHKNELVQPEGAKVNSILVKVEGAQGEYQALQQALSILERLKKGESFEKLARLYPQGASSVEERDLGFIEQGQLIKEIDEAIFSLNPGEFTDVLKTNQGYRIFKVEEKKPQRMLDFSEAQDAIKQILYGNKFNTNFKEWMDKLKQQAYIEYHN